MTQHVDDEASAVFLPVVPRRPLGRDRRSRAGPVPEFAAHREDPSEESQVFQGLLKLQTLKDLGFFGRILSVRGEFGYWACAGATVPAQRPSWNYRKEDGGGLIIDMLCHWRYVLDNLFGAVRAVSCMGATHIPERRDESGAPYKCTADDSAYATF